MASAVIRWFDFACRLKVVPTDALRLAGYARAQICTLRKLAQIDRKIGALLDDLCAPWAVVRYVAHGKPEEQRERAEQALATLIERRERSGYKIRGYAASLARILKADVLPGLHKAYPRPEPARKTKTR